MKLERYERTTVEQLISLLQHFEPNDVIVICADGSSSFPDEGVWVANSDDNEVSIGCN